MLKVTKIKLSILLIYPVDFIEERAQLMFYFHGTPDNRV